MVRWLFVDENIVFTHMVILESSFSVLQNRDTMKGVLPAATVVGQVEKLFHQQSELYALVLSFG